MNRQYADVKNMLKGGAGGGDGRNAQNQLGESLTLGDRRASAPQKNGGVSYTVGALVGAEEQIQILNEMNLRLKTKLIETLQAYEKSKKS